MLIDLPILWIVVLNVAGWPVIQFGLAWAFTRMPVTWFNPGGAHAWEQGGRFYERAFGIKRWKDWLPDAASWFGGGFAKATLLDTKADYLRRFIRETWRGEVCHWCALGCAPLYFFWNPWWADLVMVTYAGADLLRPPQLVPWAKPVDQLLREMQRKRLHMAIVVDEFGGVMGICTLEDVLEHIVGDIRDEYEEEGKAIEALPDGSFAVQGATPIAELNQMTGLAVPEDQGFETVAGFVNSLAGAIPAVGDRFAWRGWHFTVSEADRRRALPVRVARVKRTGPAQA